MLTVEDSSLGEEGDVWQVLDPGVFAFARERVGVQFLGDMGFARVDAQPRGGDAREREKVASVDLLGIPRQQVAERGIDSEWIAIRTARESCVDPEATAFVDDSFAFDRVTVWSKVHLEEQVVPLVSSACCPELLQHGVWAPHAAQIHILRGASPGKAQLESHTPFEHRALTQDREHSHQEPFEDEPLAYPVHGDALLRRGTPQTGFERLLECIGREVSP